MLLWYYFRFKMETEQEKSTRENETKNYLEEHQVLELFNNLTAQLIFQRPGDPKKFMIDTLERLQKSKSTKRDYPCLFDDSNVQSVYGMLDPTNRGHITLVQYKEALTTLGITNFNEKPEGAYDDRITFETFLTEAISLCNHCCGVHWLHNQLVNSADPDETAPAGAVSSGSFTIYRKSGLQDASATFSKQ